MDDFLYGFPPPPIFYHKYNLKLPNPENPLESKLQDINKQLNLSNELVFNYSNLKCFEGPSPPDPPTESWYSFGTQEKFKEDEFTLDSETLIPIDSQTKDLREHFKSLYAEFINSLITYLDQLKNMNNDSISEIKKFIKLYVNLQYILTSLWRRQTEQEVLDMLKSQLKRKKRYLDSMKLRGESTNQKHNKSMTNLLNMGDPDEDKPTKFMELSINIQC